MIWLKRLAAWFEKPKRAPAPGELSVEEMREIDQAESEAVDLCLQVIRGERAWQTDAPTKEDLRARVDCHNYIWQVRGKRR